MKRQIALPRFHSSQAAYAGPWPAANTPCSEGRTRIAHHELESAGGDENLMARVNGIRARITAATVPHRSDGPAKTEGH
jgi:hypothetical protein